MSKKTRIKSDAVAVTFANREEVNVAIAHIGAAQRQRDAINTAMNEELAAVRARFEEQALPHAAVIKDLGQAVQVWCEGNRVELTRDGRTKTAKFAAGEVSWRVRPPRVSVRGEGIVIEALKRLGLERFVRTKEEVDKSAILGEPGAVQDIKGLSISQGEDFVIKPFETEIEEVQ
ncbi:host-nuclease inhibitor Gam family protein [Luteimonas soli]|uniref:Host-nuclease inhibitor Gam family protein n=1 Tax=Luteimonas soli TaxID=1648966 RepID=A0ABV7XMA0_9GAMM